STFGDGGVSMPLDFATLGSWGDALTVDTDGAMLVAGGALVDPTGSEISVLMRLTSDGSLDGDFGDGGVVSDGDPVTAASRFTGVATDATGRILMAEESLGGGVGSRIRRYLADGSTDPTWLDDPMPAAVHGPVSLAVEAAGHVA